MKAKDILLILDLGGCMTSPKWVWCWNEGEKDSHRDTIYHRVSDGILSNKLVIYIVTQNISHSFPLCQYLLLLCMGGNQVILISRPIFVKEIVVLEILLASRYKGLWEKMRLLYVYLSIRTKLPLYWLSKVPLWPGHYRIVWFNKLIFNYSGRKYLVNRGGGSILFRTPLY